MPSTQARLNKIVFKPGFYRETTKYAAEGHWWDGDRVRFRQGLPENIRGYNKFIDTEILGVPRDILSWANNNTQRLISIGTNKRLYIVAENTQYDVTPVTTVVSLTNQFNTSVGSHKILVSLTNNNTSVGDYLFFTSASINGFSQGTNFAASAFGGPMYRVVSVSGLNNFYVSTNYAAASTETAMGVATANFLINTQQTVNIQGLGYGAGPYNAGTSTTGARAWNTAANSSNIIFLANQWSLDSWGEDLLAVRRGGPLFYWDATASSTPARATIVSTAPAKINSIVVSPNDRHVIALGTYEYATSVFNPLLIRWSDQEDYANWTPSISSTSGEIKTIDGTQLVGGVRTRNAIHVWTDKAMYGLQYVGPPFIFSLAQLGSDCGLVGPHAAIAVDGSTYWMSDDNFYSFNGRVNRLDCTIKRYIFDIVNLNQRDKIFAGSNAEFNEIIWLIPANNSLEPTVYVIYNILENHWVYGTTFYTTFEDMNIFDNTITTGQVSAAAPMRYWNNEPVSIYTGDNQALSSYLESADFDLEDGDKLMFIDRIIPDYTLKSGDLQFTIETKPYPSGTPTTKGPYRIANTTTKLDVRARGRQANVKVSTADNGVVWRWGGVRIAMQPDGQR